MNHHRPSVFGLRAASASSRSLWAPPQLVEVHLLAINRSIPVGFKAEPHDPSINPQHHDSHPVGQHSLTDTSGKNQHAFTHLLRMNVGPP